MQIDKLATDVVMQAASGSYKPLSVVDELCADVPKDTTVEDHNEISTEQYNASSSCVCSIRYYSTPIVF